MQPTGVSGEEKRNFVWTSVLSIFFISRNNTYISKRKYIDEV